MSNNSNSGKFVKRGFRPLADTAYGIIDPILRRRAGLNVELLDNWPEMVGVQTAEVTMPLKIVWPRRHHEDDPFEPATLIVACEGFAAMRVQHESGEIIQRINAFFGFCAISRLKVEQRPVRVCVPKAQPERFLDENERIWVEDQVADITNDALRVSLEKLGKRILSSKKPQSHENS